VISLRYILRLIQAFLKKFGLIIFASFFVGSALFLIFGIFISKSLLTKTEKIGLVGKYTTEEIPKEILNLISNGLTKIDETGVVYPSIAKSWETSDGGKTWIFTLDENISWQNKEKLDSSSLNYQFSDAKTEKPDSKTIKFILETPFSAFPSIVSKPAFKKGLLGTGEWKVTKISVIGGYVNKLTLMDSKKNKKVFIFYPSEERLKLGYKLGEIDIAENLYSPNPFDSWKTAEIIAKTSQSHFVGLFFNTQEGFLSEKNNRQALNYAIDKTNLPGERALGSLSQNSWAYNPQVKPYEKDIEKAKELLGEAKDINLTIHTSNNLLSVAENIKKQWEEINVKTDIQVITSLNQNYQILLATVDIPKDPDQYALWHSTQPTNISKYQNARIDKLLEDGRSQIDINERKKVYLDFQRYLVEDSPAVFLYHPIFYNVYRK